VTATVRQGEKPILEKQNTCKWFGGISILDTTELHVSCFSNKEFSAYINHYTSSLMKVEV